MKLTLSLPRTRPEHLASIPAPEGCESPLLQLIGVGRRLIAERDLSSPVYHVNLPSLGGGAEVNFEVSELDGADSATGIATNDADGKLDVDVAGSPFMTFHHTTNYPKPVINPILSPNGANRSLGRRRTSVAAWINLDARCD